VTFAHPALLSLAVLVPVAGAWLHERSTRARRDALAALGDAPVLARAGLTIHEERHRLRALLRIAALTAACLALARPQGDAADVRTGRSGRDVLVALDLSRSMLVEDVGGTRLDRARALARAAASELRSDRFGLVIFGGAGFLQLPLTRDHAVFSRFLDAVSPASIDDQGTNLNAALDVAHTTFEHEGGDGHRAILMLSDGERSEGATDDAVALLEDQHVPVFAIGIGTRTGGLVPPDPTNPADSGSRWHLDNIGRPVTSRLDADVLREIATRTGGTYADWDDAAAQRTIIEGIRRISARPLGTQRVAQHVELFQWPLGLAVLLLGLEAVLALPRRDRHTAASSPPQVATTARAARAAASLAVLFLTGCSAEQRTAGRAARQYARSEFPAAFESYRQLEHSKDPLVQLGAGNAAYRVSRFEDAAASYRRAVPAAAPVERAARFNQGNAWFRAAQATKERALEFYDNAIAAYEAALRADPTDADARFNLELALRKRTESETAGSPGRSGRAQAGEGDGGEEGLDADREQAVGAMAGGGSGDAQGESVEELNEDEARRLLDGIEKEQLTSHEGRPTHHGDRAERDW